MIRRGFLRFVGFAFLLFGAITLAGRWSYNAGWTQGYFEGQVTQAEAASVEDAPPAASSQPAPAVRAPYGYYGPGYAPFGWFFAGFLKFIFFFLLAGFLFRLFFARRWFRGGRSGGWGKRPFGPHHHGPRDPHHGFGPREKRPEDVEPDIRSV